MFMVGREDKLNIGSRSKRLTLDARATAASRESVCNKDRYRIVCYSVIPRRLKYCNRGKSFIPSPSITVSHPLWSEAEKTVLYSNTPLSS